MPKIPNVFETSKVWCYVKKFEIKNITFESNHNYKLNSKLNWFISKHSLGILVQKRLRYVISYDQHAFVCKQIVKHTEMCSKYLWMFSS